MSDRKPLQTSAMTAREAIETAGEQLDRVLANFARVDAKVSSLFAVNAGMLAVLALNVKPPDLKFTQLAVLGALCVCCICGSLWFLYRASHPILKRTSTTLLFFQDIARTPEDDYVAQMRRCDDREYFDQLTQQIWRNSTILSQKFECLKTAFLFSASAAPFWFAALATAASVHAEISLK